jgi:hypothetical protein
MGTIDWTVSLVRSSLIHNFAIIDGLKSRAFPFFLSLVSADGQMWSFGPLHAGGFGPSDCCKFFFLTCTLDDLLTFNAPVAPGTLYV